MCTSEDNKIEKQQGEVTGRYQSQARSLGSTESSKLPGWTPAWGRVGEEWTRGWRNRLASGFAGHQMPGRAVQVLF